MSEKRRKFDKEFREGVVRLVNETSKSVGRGGPRDDQRHREPASSAVIDLLRPLCR